MNRSFGLAILLTAFSLSAQDLPIGRMTRLSGMQQPGPHDGIFDVTLTQLGQRTGRQQMGDGNERDRLGRPVRGNPQHATACRFGTRRAFVGEAGLADAGRAVDAERLAAFIRQRRGERIEFVVSPYERPASRDRHDMDRSCSDRPGPSAETESDYSPAGAAARFGIR